MLSDPPGAVAKPYGAKGLLPIFSRKTFLVDGRGVVRMAIDGMPDPEAILTFLDAMNGDLGPA